jgi:hypothetical protein
MSLMALPIQSILTDTPSQKHQTQFDGLSSRLKNHLTMSF